MTIFLPPCLSGSPTKQVLAEDGSVPTLKDLRTKDKKEHKHSSLLPNDYLFSAKGKIDYDKLKILEFVGGFLEFLNSQPESAQQRYLAWSVLQHTPGTAYEISTFQSIQRLKPGICLFNSLTRSSIGHKLSSLMPTCLQLRPLLAFQPCLLKHATERKTPIAKSGITQASVTAHEPKRHTRAFTIAMFAMQTTQCYNVRNVASQSLAVSPARLNQKTKLD